ncbi:MAG: hypothetical protein AAF599_11785, partial [Bacteroidota bacterium]
MGEISKYVLKKEQQSESKIKHLKMRLDNLENEKRVLVRKLAKHIIDDGMFILAMETLKTDTEVIEQQLAFLK